MLRRIFHSHNDGYRGYEAALWLLALFLLIKSFASINAMNLNPLWSNSEILKSVERVSLDTFSTNAENTTRVLFAWWGVTALVLSILSLIVIFRFREMIPIVYLLTLVNHIGQQLLSDVSPLVKTLGAGELRPLTVIVVLLVGFGMSLTTPQKKRTIQIQTNT